MTSKRTNDRAAPVGFADRLRIATRGRFPASFAARMRVASEAFTKCRECTSHENECGSLGTECRPAISSPPSGLQGLFALPRKSNLRRPLRGAAEGSDRLFASVSGMNITLSDASILLLAVADLIDRVQISIYISEWSACGRFGQSLSSAAANGDLANGGGKSCAFELRR